jgi:NTP pyrophosphatase (non-canonical NTP hydrolase)
MEITTYQKEASRTLSIIDGKIMDDLHMVLGMQTESAEIADAYKKHIAYGNELDLVNVKEELGDILWYIANMCNLHGWDMRDVMETNIAKLKFRYPEKFDSEKANNRDLESERKILEK